MIDPVITNLVSNVMSVLMPYVVKGAEDFAQLAGKAAYVNAQSLFRTLKEKLASDEEARDSLSRFEEKPERYRPVLEDILQERLAEDEVLANELKKLLQGMEPDLEIIQKMDVGVDVTGLEAEEMAGGKAKIEQDIKEAKNVTGAKIKRIGS
jgi:hypothetical protein